MKKIIFTLIFILSLLRAEDTFFDLNSSSKNSIFSLVGEFTLQNTNLEEYRQKSDNNLSVYEKEVALIKLKKQELLQKLPSTIAEQEIDKNKAQEFLTLYEKTELEFKNINKNDAYAYAQAKLNLSSLQLSYAFYSSLIDLEGLFKQASNAQSIENLTSQSLNKLEQIMDFDLSTQKEKLSNSDQRQYIQMKEEALKIQFQSYEEVLKYLKDNAHLLAGNYLFSQLNFEVLITKINQFVNIPYINSGKIVLSLGVLILFYVLAIFLQYFTNFIIVRFILHIKNKGKIENIFVTKGRKPVKAFLFVYALSVCASIAYYPAPLSIWLTNILYIVYAVLSCWFIMSMLDSYGVVLIAKLAQTSGKKEVANLIIKILYFVVIIITGLFILAHLGFNVSAIIASLGIGGLAVALAAKDIIANFFASILLAFDDSFNQGDWVEISGVEGTVVETGLRKTTLRTFENSLIFLPNSVILNANIKNWSKRRVGRMVRMYLGVEYDSTPEQIEQCVKDLKAYLEQSELVAHPEDNALNFGGYTTKYRQNLVSINDLEGYKNSCYVALSEFADSSINIELYFYTKAIDAKGFREARQALMLEFMRIIQKNKMTFAFPSMSIYVENFKDVNTVKSPS